MTPYGAKAASVIRGFNVRHYKQYVELQHSVPIADLFLVAFVVLKLVGVIDWSWWWVLSPIWIMLGIAGLVFVTIYIYIAIKNIIKRRKELKKKA